MTPAQRAEKLDRGRAFSSSWPIVRRIQKHLDRLGHNGTTRADRLVLWRLLSDAALDAWEKEVSELDSLNSLKADPSMALEIVE